MTLRLDPGMTVRFVLDNETITGSHLATLCFGVIADERPVVPCALRQIVPVHVATVDDTVRLLWISDDQILTASTHPTGGFP